MITKEITEVARHRRHRNSLIIFFVFVFQFLFKFHIFLKFVFNFTLNSRVADPPGGYIGLRVFFGRVATSGLPRVGKNCVYLHHMCESFLHDAHLCI